MEERERLLERLDQARRAMQAVLTDVDTQREIYPQWTIKEILAHIGGWDEVATDALRAHAAGDTSPRLAVSGIDAQNAQMVACCEELTYEQVVGNWKLARRQLKAVLSEMPTERLGEAFPFPWGGKGNTARVVAILADHEKEHATEVLAILTAEATEE
jgi:hypothetical protein